MSKSELLKFVGDRLTFSEAKITSVTLSEQGGTINVTGHPDIYELIYLAYNLTLNPNILTKGASTREALGYGESGARNTASLGGVWVGRERTMTHFILDDVSDGNFHFTVVELALDDETDTINFSRVTK